MNSTGKKKSEAEASAMDRETAVKTVKRRSSAPCVPAVFVEVEEQQYDISNIVVRAKRDYRSGHRSAVRSCRIYIKPQDGMAYYVINQTEGRVPLEEDKA